MATYATTIDLRIRTSQGVDGSSSNDQLILELTRSDIASEQDLYLEAMLLRAEGIIDAYAGRYYQVPMPASGFLQDICLAISEYELFKRGLGDNTPAKYKLSYDEAMKMLREDIGTGIVIPPNAKAIANSGIDFSSNDAMFTQAQMDLM